MIFLKKINFDTSVKTKMIYLMLVDKRDDTSKQ